MLQTDEKLSNELDNILILTVGLPRSGKSTWAKNYVSNMTRSAIVCPDEIRLALHGQAFHPAAESFVWGITEIMIKSLFASGAQQVILDATNITKDNRSKWDKPKLWNIRYKVFDTSLEKCLFRAEETDFPKSVIHRMHKQFEPLTKEEQQHETYIL